jgi:hypothetical protein
MELGGEQVHEVEAEVQTDTDAGHALVLALASRLDRIEAVVGEIRSVVTLNGELMRRNVALTHNQSGEPRHVAAPHGAAPHGAAPAAAERVVNVRLADDAVALIANSATYEMRDDLKRAGARWSSDAPPRWTLPRTAWDENCTTWESSYRVSFSVA